MVSEYTRKITLFFIRLPNLGTQVQLGLSTRDKMSGRNFKLLMTSRNENLLMKALDFDSARRVRFCLSKAPFPDSHTVISDCR